VLPDARLVKLIRRCGGPMLFSGPIQPPMRGAAVTSARLHLQPAFPNLQAEAAARIERATAARARQSARHPLHDHAPQQRC